MSRVSIIVLAISLVAAVAAADSSEPLPPSIGGVPTGRQGVPTPPAGAPGADAKAGLHGHVGGGLAFEKIKEDYFLAVELENTLSFGPLSFGVWVPLRLRIIDKDPDDDGVLRKEDWDEVSDFAKLLRFVELRLGGETWHVRGRIGTLEGESIGHGTILAGYFNNVDPDHYQGGLAVSTAIKYGGIELMLDNLLAPEIFGSRVHLRPTSFFTDNRWANKLAVGFSLVADVKAPVALVDQDSDPDHFEAEIDDENNYAFASTKFLGVFGVDVEYALLRGNGLIDLVPYVDVNFIFDEKTGVGAHFGTFFNVHLPLSIDLLTRLEYRVVGDGYAPRYFDALYEPQRVMFAPTLLEGAVPVTKLGWLRQGDTGHHGWLGELYFNFANLVRVGGTYEDYIGPNNAALTLALLVPKIWRFQAAAFYTNRGFDSFEGAFDLENAMLRAYLRVNVWGPFYVHGIYTRTWAIDEHDEYVAEDEFSFGASVGYSY